jgi:arsenate reductase (glutaredoxin)
MIETWGMADALSFPNDRVVIFHNPNCGSSNNALAIASELGVDADIVVYQKTPPDSTALRWLVAHLEDPVSDLVRKDSQFEKLGLDAADYTTADAVVDVIVKHKMLMQRPLIIKGDKVIIGRPKDRVRKLLS